MTSWMVVDPINFLALYGALVFLWTSGFVCGQLSMKHRR